MMNLHKIMIWGVLFYIYLSNASLSNIDAPTSETLINHYTLMTSEESIDFLSNINNKQGSVYSFYANFIQSHHLVDFNDVLEAKGSCGFKKPNSLRWEIIDPYRSILIYNAGEAAKFTIDQKGVFNKSDEGSSDILRETLKRIVTLMRGDMDSTEKDYNLHFYSDKDIKLSLTPKSDALKDYILSIDIHMFKESFNIIKIVIHEPYNDYLVITFDGVEENATFPINYFSLTNPYINIP